jgi:thiamine-monophosphate kinase
VVRGIGDDAAVLALEPDHYLLWTIDTLVEGVHFDLDYISLKQLGRKALAVNLSDIAAMGGKPQYALWSLGWKPGQDLEGALEAAAGLQEMARQFQVALIGGDTVKSPAGLMLTLTVIGRVRREELLTRDGAQIGDTVYVSGPLGEAAAGLEVLRQGLDLPATQRLPLITAFLDPQPQLTAARILAKGHLATALIDLSDGVASDLDQICRQSKVGAQVQAEQVPVPERVRQVAALLQRDPLNLALMGGEDYGLLFTVSPRQEEKLTGSFSSAGLPPPVAIGRIVSGEAVSLVLPTGERDISGTGFDHFT